jgi:hypothetical protein
MIGAPLEVLERDPTAVDVAGIDRVARPGAALGELEEQSRRRVESRGGHPGHSAVTASFSCAAAGNWLPPSQVFGVLDTNGNGRLGDDIPLDGNSGTWSDVEGNRLVIRLHEDYVVLNGITSLSASDWLT